MKKFVILLVLILALLCLSSCDLILATSAKFTDDNEIPCTLMFSGDSNNINIGKLLYQPLDAEKEEIADNVQKNEFMLLPKTQAVLYLDKDNTLYYKQRGKEKEKVSDSVIKSSFTYSSDENTIAFLIKSADSKSVSAELYIRTIGSEKEKIASDMNGQSGIANYSLSTDASVVFFLNQNGELYRKAADSDREKIASDVSKFSVNPSGTSYAYMNKNSSYYVNWTGDTASEKIDIEDIKDFILSESGYIAAFRDSGGADKGSGELYVIMKGCEPVRVASEVVNFKLTDDSKYLYYLNDENTVYVKELPNAAKETKQQKFEDDLNNSEKIKLCSDVMKYDVSPDGRNCLFIDNDGNLYISYKHKEKIKAGFNVTQAKVFADSFVFLNKEEDLTVNRKIKDLDNIKENSNVIAPEVAAFVTSPYGKYITFASAGGDSSIYLCTNGQEPELLIDKGNNYDEIIYSRYPVYEKKLTLSDITGMYKNDKLGQAYKISSDGLFTVYEKGVTKESVAIHVNGIDKLNAALTTDIAGSAFAKSSYRFSFKLDGTKILTIGGTSYTLTSLTVEQLNKELDRQKRVEAEAKRKAEEAAKKKAEEARKKAELQQRIAKANERGKAYLRNGVYVTSNQTLYNSANTNSASDMYFVYPGYKTVVDYKVSSDGYRIWLKVEGEYGYFWVYTE